MACESYIEDNTPCFRFHWVAVPKEQRGPKNQVRLFKYHSVIYSIYSTLVCSAYHNKILLTQFNFSHSGGWKSKVKVPAAMVSGRPLFLFLWGHKSYWIRAPPLGLHVTFMNSLKALSPNIVMLGFRTSTCEFEEDRVQSKAYT